MLPRREVTSAVSCDREPTSPHAATTVRLLEPAGLERCRPFAICREDDRLLVLPVMEIPHLRSRCLNRATMARGSRDTLGAVGAVIVILLAGCTTEIGFTESLPPEAEVYYVTVIGEPDEVEFGIDLCSRPLVSLTIKETPDEVRVTATSERGPDPDDCSLSVQRTLEAPLGDRVVIDESRDEIVERR